MIPSFASMKSRGRVELKNRARASKACLVCRRRKVRCTVARDGQPCVNCVLDGHPCVVVDRAVRGFRKKQKLAHDVPNDDADPRRTSIDSTHDNSIDGESPQYERTEMSAQGGRDAESATNSSSRQDKGTRRPSNRRGASDGNCALHQQPEVALPGFSSECSYPMDMPSLNQYRMFRSEVTYSAYPFLTVSNMSNMPPEDINYLDIKKCLSVPAKPILDEFVQQYFRFVHPMMPLINEAIFWNVYHQVGERSEMVLRMPLVVLQSMLFAACSYVSQGALERLGYTSIRAARKAFYQRAKSLYDFEAESSRLHIAQAALLLSYWSPSVENAVCKRNVTWLAIAIESAKSVKAHQAHRIPVAPTELGELQLQNSLKRLWGCCIVRDSLLSISLRRSCRISNDNLDVESAFVIGYADLATEAYHSKVYNPATKKHLAMSFLCLAEMCVKLNGVSSLLFPYERGCERKYTLSSEHEIGLRNFQNFLDMWHKTMTTRLSTQSHRRDAAPRSEAEVLHPSTTLYNNFASVYYYCLKIALTNRTMLVCADSCNFDVSNAGNHHEEIQNAIEGIVSCMRALSNLNLIRFLPVSVVACIALPLAIHLIDCRITMRKPGADPDPLIKAMKTYECLYDGVEWIAETIRLMLGQTQLAQCIESIFSTAQVSSDSWKEIISSYPNCYLKLVVTMDLSFNQGRLPDPLDFPLGLRQPISGRQMDRKAALGIGLADSDLLPIINMIQCAENFDTQSSPDGVIDEFLAAENSCIPAGSQTSENDATSTSWEARSYQTQDFSQFEDQGSFADTQSRFSPSMLFQGVSVEGVGVWDCKDGSFWPDGYQVRTEEGCGI